MRRTGIGLALTLLCVIALAGMSSIPARAGEPPVPMQFVFTDGHSESLVFDGYKEDRLLFKAKQDKAKREVALRDLFGITFTVGDSVSTAAADSCDVLYLRDGTIVPVMLRKFDKERLKCRVASDGWKLAEFKTADVRAIVFGDKVLDDDRHDYGTSFNILGDDLEVAMGLQYGNLITDAEPVLADSLVTAYVNDLGQRIAAASRRRDIPYSFQVIDSKTVNAFTVGGGRVFIYRGLIDQMSSEAELAGVIAHEVGHIVGKHTARSLTNQLIMAGVVAAGGELLSGGDEKRRQAITEAGGAVAYFQQLDYSRDDEREADFLATYTLYRMGYDPRAMASVFETLRKNAGGDPTAFEVFFQTHPAASERIANTEAELPKLDLNDLRSDTPAFHEVQARLAKLPYPLRELALTSQAVSIPAGGTNHLVLTLNPRAFKEFSLCGRILAQGGTGNDVRILLLDELNYLNWSNGHAAKAIYDSGVITAAEMEVPIRVDGQYRLVFDNKFSWVTDKTVQCDLVVRYRE